MAAIFIRTIIIYLLLIFSMKIMGKREIGELEINELVSTLLVSEIAAMPITEPDIPLLNAIIPILFIVSSEILIAYLKNKSAKVKKIIEGEPVYLIKNGKLNSCALQKNRISLNELLCEMRMQSIFNIHDVQYAILEQNGNISFLAPQNSNNMAHYVVIDGSVDKELLRTLGLNESWLLGALKKRKTKLEDVFLLSVDDKKDINIIIKEEK